jgi:hypothetical protein
MEPDGSLPVPCSQEPSTGPYPEPDQSSIYHSILSKSILILSTYLRLGLPNGSFLLVLPPISHMPQFVLHVLPTSSSLT